MNRLVVSMASFIPLLASASEPPTSTSLLLKQSCYECHNKETTEGGLDLTAATASDAANTTLSNATIIHHHAISL